MIPGLIHYEVLKHNAAQLLPDHKPAPDRAVWFVTENFAWVLTPQRPDGARDIITRVKL